MTLQEAYDLIDRSKRNTKNKSEIKACENFIHLLSELMNRDFSQEQILSIEIELDALHLNLIEDSRNISKAYRRFEKFLRETLYITPKGYYSNLGIATGSLFGLLIGTIFMSSFERSLSVGLGLSLGMLTGLLIGRHLDTLAISEGRAL